MLPSSLTIAILCGGKSSRFGSNKALALVDDLPMIEWIVKQVRKITPNLILVTNTPNEYAFLNLPCVTDANPYAGPLAALLTIFEKTHYQQVVLLACDMPHLDPELIQALSRHASGADACVIQDDAGPQYLFARYSRRLLEPLSEFVGQGGKSFKDFFKLNPSCLSLIYSNKKILNVNTLRDMKEFQCCVI